MKRQAAQVDGQTDKGRWTDDGKAEGWDRQTARQRDRQRARCIDRKMGQTELDV